MENIIFQIVANCFIAIATLGFAAAMFVKYGSKTSSLRFSSRHGAIILLFAAFIVIENSPQPLGVREAVAQTQFTIIAEAGTGGEILPSDDVLTTLGSEPTFTIRADDCYKIESVTVDGNPVDFSPNARFTVGFYTFSRVAANHNIKAAFIKKTHTITAAAGTGGSISPSGSVTANCGENAVFTIMPGQGYKIGDVLVDGVSVGGITAYTFANVISAHTVEAVFVSEYKYTLNVSKTGNGQVTGGGNYAAGATVNLTATPDSGYSFSGWSPSPCANSFAMPNNDLTCTANFESLIRKISITPSAQSFGDVSIGASVTKTFTISNTGNSPLTVSSISYPSGFTGNWSGGTIAAGASQSVIVTFTPTAVQAYSGTITVNSDKTEGINTIAVSGTGTAIPTRIINLNGNLTFGNVNVGSTKQLTFTVSNSGNSALTVSSITYPAGFSGNWSGGTITASDSVTVIVTFAPTAAQSYSGTVTVNSDKTEGTNTIAVSGTGTPIPTRIISLNGNLTFGNVNVGSTKQLTFTVSNSGNSALTVNLIAYPAGFSGNWSGGTITASGSVTVTVTFSPTAVQTYSGIVTVNSDKTDGTNTIAISGTGTAIPARIINLNGNLTFGNVNVGSTKQLTFTISNSGNSPLTVSSIIYPAGFSGNWSGGIIMASGSVTVTVTFAPTAAQAYSGTVTVNSDKTEGINTIAVSGTGTAIPTRIINLNGNLDFGNVNVGSTKQLVFTISNTGNSALNVSSITCPDGFSGNWSGSIPAGSSQSVTVTFSPTFTMTYGGNLRVSSNATSGTNIINVSGTGIEVANQKPAVNIIDCPSGILTTSSYTFRWSGSDADGSISGYYYDLDNSLPNSSTTGTSKTYSNLSNGSHTFYVKAKDDDGAYSSVVSCQFYVNKPQLVSTLILVNRQQMERLYGDVARLMDKLDALAEHPDVQGLVVQVESNPAVADAYRNRGENFNDRNRANVVAEAIKQQFIIPRQDDLNYIVIIGDDRIIPFYRIFDQTTHRDPWTLTDNFYTDMVPAIGYAGSDNPNIFVPDIASGRLVETPDQIINFIDNFLNGNILNLERAVVVNDNTPDDPTTTEIHEGAQFLEDGARNQYNILQGDNIDTDCTLIDDNWDAKDFIGRILDHRHDATSINLHANPYEFGTPDINDDNFVSADDFQNAQADFSGALFYTLGCHSGQSMPYSLDLPEAIAGKRAYYVANTGFGWGATGGIGFSEQLMLDFTRLLVEGSEVALGDVLTEAKQNYYVGDRNFDGTDEKVMAESTLYGLPMYKITSPDASPLATGITANRGQVSQTGLLQRESISYSLTPKAVTMPEGTFYTLDGTVSGKEGTPVLPKLTHDVTNAEKRLHGVVFKGGKYSVVKTAPPLQRYHTTDEPSSNNSSSSTFTTVGWYPAKFFTHNSVEFSRGKMEKLIATAGQYNSADGGQQRIFDTMDFDFYYHADSGDQTPPTVNLISKDLQGDVVNLNVSAIDASGIEVVIVAYTDSEGEWKSIELTQNGEIWTGSFPNTDKADFLIQAVDKAGNVAVSDSGSTIFNSGVFTVGEEGLVKVDWLYDGGAYESELGIFSLAGMKDFTPNSPEFIAEAVRRVLSNSEQGYIVISDRTQGARFSGQLGSGKEPNRNKGIYKGLKSCNMKAGDTFATVLVPNSTFVALSGNPATTDPAKRPIFSLASSNPEHEMYFGQIAKIKDGDSEFVNAVVYEDMLLSSGSDRDYNDLIVHFSGVTLSAPTLDNPELGFKEDWRKSQNPVIPHIEVSPPDPDTLWITITLKSPADLFVYDPQGRVIGKEGGNIPGATFETGADGHQIVSLPKLDSGEYRVVLRAIGEGGLCHLEVKGYKGENELAAKEIPFTIGAHETFTTLISADDFLGSTVIDFGTPDVPVSESGEPLNYDFNGDGLIDDADIARLSSIWNKCRGDAEFDPFFDLDNDGCITVLDIMQVAK